MGILNWRTTQAQVLTLRKSILKLPLRALGSLHSMRTSRNQGQGRNARVLDFQSRLARYKFNLDVAERSCKKGQRAPALLVCWVSQLEEATSKTLNIHATTRTTRKADSPLIMSEILNRHKRLRETRHPKVQKCPDLFKLLQGTACGSLRVGRGVGRALRQAHHHVLRLRT